MVFADRISGTDGKVTIPSIGALIGYFNKWHLVSPDKKTYTLSASFGYINPALWRKTENGEFTRKIVIQVGKERFYRLEETGGKVDLNETSLTMEKVTLWPLEGR